MSPSPDSPSADAAAQLPASQRIAVLDILRGFALMGILIMNMPSFSASMFAEADGSHLWPGALDQAAEQIRDLLFSGKFNGIFSLLFGLGFTLQFGRMLQADPQHAQGLYLRRLLVLLAMGVVHACVFWIGDILHWYALLGLLLVFGLRHASDRTVIGLIVLSLLYPTFSGLARLVWMTPEVVALQVAQEQAFHSASVAAFGHGSFWDTMALNTRLMVFEYTDPWSLFGMFGGYVMIATTMLLGMLAGRRRWVQRIPELMPQIRRLTIWALVLGLLLGAAFTVIFELNRTPGPSAIKMVGGLCYRLSRLSLMVFYILAIVRLAQHPAWLRAFGTLAAAGRMPLTNYLMQTLICVTLFNAWGLGFWGRMGPAAGLLLSLGIFWLVQVPWSLWWLRTHERGPMEALWARLTYGRRGNSAGSLPRTA
jgi:uncharacterized protein